MSDPSDIQAPSFTDSHAHLDMEHFDTDRQDVIRRAIEAGVTSMINVGIDVASSNKAVELAHQYPAILAAAGIHPQETSKTVEADIVELSRIAHDPRVVGIGEIGLDFYRDYSPREQQIKIFRWQLALSDEVKKPIIVHCRKAEQDVLQILSEWSSKSKDPSRPAGVIHCFNGTLDLAQAYIKLGFFISLGAYAGYPSSKDLREAIKELPMNKILIETDCPFLPPQSRRGQRNEPSYVVETAKEIAAIRGMKLKEVAIQTTANARKLFRIPL